MAVFASLDERSKNSSSEYEDDERAGFLNEKTIKLQIRRPRRLSLFVTMANLLLFVVTIALWASWYYKTYLVLNPELRRTSTYSKDIFSPEPPSLHSLFTHAEGTTGPIHDLFDLKMHKELVNGTLFPDREHPSIARLPPRTPEADALWDEWELTRPFPVTAAQIRAMGKDPSTAAKLEDADWGLGDDAYAAVLDVYHQLHCLNSLRKAVYRAEYGAPELAEVSEAMMRVHVDHCVDILMQALQCSGNVNLVTMHWLDTQDYPFPDMSIERQCVDFEGLTAWRRRSTLDMDKWARVMARKPPGVKEEKAPEEFHTYFGGGGGGPGGDGAAAHGGHVHGP
ncbi:uncharacterized protein E0L32_005378 [Thyridium curvatum]|uniref:Uncharacterized protein n=1 Tax=Thyridium curvatum TaxID=1093900 RepID=A0A507B6Y2_9PEZI|nr:uncharacterized protein E0L32_005378 [Thyridium curvatum]TPX14414.1 hypothetical protein E0L32_005378 [Thyridium curvatum]